MERRDRPIPLPHPLVAFRRWAAQTTERRSQERLAILDSAREPPLRGLGFLLRPLFKTNLKWAMEQGCRSRELDLARYRSGSVEELNRIARRLRTFCGGEDDQTSRYTQRQPRSEHGPCISMTVMEDRTIRPSMKAVWAAYIAAVAIWLAGVWAWYTYADDKPVWLIALPLIAFYWPLRMHLRRRFVTMRLHDGHITFESGFLSRTRRTVDMVKIQDVTVRQTLGQRLWGVGDLRLESAGESGSMGIPNVDRPREIADLILAGSKRGSVL